MKKVDKRSDSTHTQGGDTETFFTKNKILVSALASIMLLIAIGVGFFVFRDTVLDPIVIKVDESIVYKSEYDTIVNEAKRYDVSEKDARNVIIENMKHSVMADKYDIELDEYEAWAVQRASAEEFINISDPVERVDALLELMDDRPKFLEMAQYTKAIEVQLAARSTPGKQVVIYNFPAIYKLDPNGTNKIAQSDLDFAKNTANKVRDGLVDGSVSIKDALDIVLKDPRFSFSNTSNGSGMYYTRGDNFIGHMTGNWDNDNTGRGTSPAVWEYISNIDEPSIGEVQEEYMYDSRFDESVLASYFFVQVLRVNEGGDDLRAEFENALSDVRVVEYDN